MDIFVCRDGLVATINNALASSKITATVIVPDVPNLTMTEFFNSEPEQFFSFVEPISKLVEKGNAAKCTDAPNGVGRELAVMH